MLVQKSGVSTRAVGRDTRRVTASELHAFVMGNVSRWDRRPEGRPKATSKRALRSSALQGRQRSLAPVASNTVVAGRSRNCPLTHVAADTKLIPAGHLLSIPFTRGAQWGVRSVG